MLLQAGSPGEEARINNGKAFLASAVDIFKGSRQLDAFYPLAIVYCYLEFKLRYLKNLKSFSIIGNELSEPIVLWRKGDGI